MSTVTNEDILEELRAWHRDVLAAYEELRARVDALEARTRDSR